MVSESFICCRYCGHMFRESDIPKECCQKVYDPDTRSCKCEDIAYVHRRCPSCLHSLTYEKQIDIPSIVVWKMQWRMNPDTNKLEFRNERRYVRKM